MGSPALPVNAYTKPYLSVAEQIELLKRRGLVISDEEAAHACLERIGYYRLSAYWYPFRKSHFNAHPVTGKLLPDSKGKYVVIVEDDFRPGASFPQVMDLYVFDNHMDTLPGTNGIALQQAGFPGGWDELPLWN